MCDGQTNPGYVYLDDGYSRKLVKLLVHCVNKLRRQSIDIVAGGINNCIGENRRSIFKF